VTRRRLALVASAAVLGLATFGATAAPADTAGSSQGVITRASSDGYIACVAVDVVQVGTCVRNPIPDPRTLPRPGDLLP